MLNAIFCDFDGVLYNFDNNNLQDGLYSGIKNVDSVLYKKITNFLFKQDKFIFYAWMKGYVNHNDLNVLMANKFGVDINYLNQQLFESITKFKLNWELIEYLNSKRNKLKVYIVSDNLTTFNDILVPYFKLNEYFDKIYSSSEYHIMKKNNENQWIKDILIENNLKANEVLFIDDGEELITQLKNFDMNTYLYNNEIFSNFKNWFESKY